MFASLFLVGASFATPQLAVQSASQTIVEDSATGMARGVNRMIGGIVSYAKWPDGTTGPPATVGARLLESCGVPTTHMVRAARGVPSGHLA